MKYNSTKDKQRGGFKNRLFPIKTSAAVLTGKLLISFTRLLGRGGTTLPGRSALILDRHLVSRLAAQIKRGNLVITGTNGKTTTASLIKNILRETGAEIVHNQAGSNMSWGVTTAMVEAARISGKLDKDYAVLEVDEGAFPAVVRSVEPSGIVVTNIFRDQLDRYGEIDSIQNAISEGLNAQPAGGFRVINADDPSLAAFPKKDEIKLYTYGLELHFESSNDHDTGRDLKTCPLCKRELAYHRLYYAHLGHYYCPGCSFKRKNPIIRLTGYKELPAKKAYLTIEHPGGTINCTTSLPGIYNLYNLLAALSSGLALQVPPNIIIRSIEKAEPSFGRMEQFQYKDITLTMALIKNPVGANEVIRTLIRDKEPVSLLVAINDKIADGTDVSWLWDVNFEQLLQTGKRPDLIIASGLRAWDMAVRFKYAGFSEEEITILPNTGEALKESLNRCSAGSNLYILPSYTAMLEIRQHLNKMGLARPYWEGD